MVHTKTFFNIPASNSFIFLVRGKLEEYYLLNRKYETLHENQIREGNVSTGQEKTDLSNKC